MAVGESKTILFVNKTAKSTSLSNSSRKEQSMIFSHVQRRCKNSPTRVMPLRQKQQSGKTTSPKGQQDPSVVIARATRDDYHMQATVGKVVDRHSAVHSDLSLPSPLLELSAASIDPFDAMCATTSPYLKVMFQFYNSSYVWRVLHTKPLIDSARHHAMSFATQDATVLNTILCTVSGALYSETNDVEHLHSSIQFKDQAITHLRKKVALSPRGRLDVSGIYAISMLLWIECMQGNLDGLRAHAKGLEHLVRINGEVDTSPLPIMSTIYSCSYLCAAMLGSCPQLAPPAVAPHGDVLALVSSVITSPAHQEMAISGSSFLGPSNAHLLEYELVELIFDQRANVQFKHLCRTGYLHPTMEQTELMYKAEMNNAYSLLSLPYVSLRRVTPLQNAVRVTLFAVAQPIIFVTKPSAFNSAISQQIRYYLEQMSPLGKTDGCEMLLWVAFIAAYLCQYQKGKEWFRDKLYSLVSQLRISGVEEMAGILKGYYYFPQHFDATLHTLWQEMQESSAKAFILP